MRLLGAGAEIGVGEGHNALAILNRWKGAHLWLVDLYQPQPAEIYRDKLAGSDFAQAKAAATTRLQHHAGRWELLEKLSTEAALVIGDHTLDFVYIDANHSAAAVTADLIAWYPKVRPGGILGGHDFAIRQDAEQDVDVVNPVLEFSYARGLPLFISPCTSWWLQV